MSSATELWTCRCDYSIPIHACMLPNTHAAPTSRSARSVTADPDKDWTRLASKSLMASAHGAHVDDSLIRCPD